MTVDERGPLVLGAAAPRAIEWTTETLVEGGVIVLPTDTVYGVAASLFSAPALERVFEIKGRDRSKTLPILVSSLEALERITDELDDRTAVLLDRFWPGPLTIALPARDGLNPLVVADDGTVGVRMPNHPLALEVIERAGGAVACTSANRSGEPPACNAAMAAEAIGDRVDMTLDGGITPGGVPSTVISFVGDGIVVVREGAITKSELAEVWGEVSGGEPK